MPTAALLLIDLQNDYFDGGAMRLEGSEAAVARAADLLAAARAAGRPVIHIQHLSTRPGATFFLPGTAGAEIHAAVAPREEETVIHKHFPNSFRDTALADTLRLMGVDHVVVAGMMTHMCVDSTVRAAADHGLRVTLAGDACATVTQRLGDTEIPAPTVHAAFLAALNGSFAKVTTAAEASAALA